MGLFIFATFTILILLGVPVGFGFGITSLLAFLKLDSPGMLTILSQRFFSGMDSFSLLALPFFLLAGDIMNKVGLTERLMAFANLFVGRLRGGLAHANIVSSIIFGGVSGSAVADVAALGSIFIPAMAKEGYEKEFSTALIVASSIVAPIIPPSIIMVIYGATMGVSIAGLFAAGIIPGVLIGVGLMIYTAIISNKRKYPRHTVDFYFKNSAIVTGRAMWALLMPIIILGGMLFGFATPTEAAAIAVAYSLFLGFVIYRTLTLKDLYRILFDGAVLMGVISVIISSASVIAWLLASERVPEMMAQLFISISMNKYIILLMINIFLLVVGMFMDIIPALLILAPILAPLAIKVGVNPLHFGIMMCVNLTMGLMTPPVGGCLFVAMAMTGLKMGAIVRHLWPMIIIEVTVLFSIIYIPEISMFIPKLLGYAK
jgi:tripartite ATP-independent transporter DctM subunit